MATETAQQCASTAFRALNGVFCVFKPPQRSHLWLRHHLKEKLAKGLNRMPSKPLQYFIHVEPSASNLPTVTATPDLRDHKLVLGQAYSDEDIRLKLVSSLGMFASGVQVIGIANGCGYCDEIKEANLMRVYHVVGQLGRVKHNYLSVGRTLEKTTYKHVTVPKLERVLSSIQSTHQQQMFKMAGVDIQSQEAYELAAKGLVRPRHEMPLPVVYGIKCIDFNLPHFTLEIHTLNESMPYLANLIHQIGELLKSSAYCTQLRRIRHGPFTLSHALLRSQWTVPDVLENIKTCSQFLTRRVLATDKLISTSTPQDALEDQEDLQLLEEEQRFQEEYLSQYNTSDDDTEQLLLTDAESQHSVTNSH